jgi:hypothetical protein
MCVCVVTANTGNANFLLAVDAYSHLGASEDYADARSRLCGQDLVSVGAGRYGKHSMAEVNEDLVINDNAVIRAHKSSLLLQRSASIRSRIYRGPAGSAAKPAKSPGSGHAKPAE